MKIRKSINNGEENRVSKAVKNPHIPRSLEEANDVEKNPGPKSPRKEFKSPKKEVSNQKRRTSRSVSTQRRKSEKDPKGDSGESTNPSNLNTPDSKGAKDDLLDVGSSFYEKDDEKIARLESEIAALQETLNAVDQNISKLHSSVDQLRPVYEEAKLALGGVTAQQQKNNLVFYGIEPDPLELDMMSEPDFCRDILETRIKGILRDYLKISREIPFFQVARIHSAPAVSGVKPIIASFINWKDKENILRQAKLLKGQGISITEDISNKQYIKGAGARRNSSNSDRLNVGRQSLLGGSGSHNRRESDYTSGDETQREEAAVDFGSDCERISSSASGTD